MSLLRNIIIFPVRAVRFALFCASVLLVEEEPDNFREWSEFWAKEPTKKGPCAR